MRIALSCQNLVRFFSFLFILSCSFAIYTVWQIQGVLCALINASTLPVPSVPSVSKYYHFFGQNHESKLLCLVFWYHSSCRFFNRFLRCLSEFRAVLRYLEPLSHCALKSILRSHKCMVPVYRTGEFPMLRICLPHKRIKKWVFWCFWLCCHGYLSFHWESKSGISARGGGISFRTTPDNQGRRVWLFSRKPFIDAPFPYCLTIY